MKLSEFELFIFDFDGTLSMPSFLVRLTRFFKRRYKIDFIIEHEDLFSKEGKVVVERRLEWREKLFSKIYDLYAFFFKPKIKPGTIEVLRELKRMKKKVALFSDGKEDRIRKELAMLRLEEYFDLILAADSIKIFKPNPTPLLLILRNMKVPKKKSVYIGDMAVDIMTARFAGISSCAVADGLGGKRDLEKAKPDFLFDNLKKLREGLKG
ncbi:MAG: HAD family hydrolase [Candidatus Micrarchaeia archaeon]|jgi:pyrophosphatase PpaX